MPRDRKRQEESDLQERVIFIHRVSKTVKGGRRMSLLALVAVGDGKGNVGLGIGKSAEVPQAISKAVVDAKKNMFHVPVTETGTIPHDVEGYYGAGHVLIKPAIEGTGVIAGGPVRPLFELAGITNVLSKSLGTSNALRASSSSRCLPTPQSAAASRSLRCLPGRRTNDGRGEDSYRQARAQLLRLQAQGHDSHVPCHGPSQDRRHVCAA